MASHSPAPPTRLSPAPQLSSLPTWSPTAQESTAPLDTILLGKSLEGVRRILRELARTPTSFLLLGPTGAGKDQAARACHLASARALRPFIALNCAAISESLFESQLFGYRRGAFTGADCDTAGILEAADGGFVLLNEITDLPPHLQAKLLQAIESKVIWRLGDPTPRKIDVWFAAASNRTDVLELCAKNKFRLDLYHRLARVRVEIPPLAERLEDLPELLVHFTEHSSRELGRRAIGFKPEAQRAFMKYPWKGNVRELENLVHELTVTSEGSDIGLTELPDHFKLDHNTKGKPVRITRDLLRQMLVKQHWKVTQVALEMGLSRGYVHFLTRRFKLTRPAKYGRQPVER